MALTQRDRVVYIACFLIALALTVGPLVYPSVVGLLSLPADVAINATCEPDGWQNEMRLAIHGRRFWSGQVAHVDREMHMIQELPRLLADRRRQMAAARLEVYRSLAATDPRSRAQVAAQMLRDKADAIEEMEADLLTIEASKARLQRLAACRPRLVHQAAQ